MTNSSTPNTALTVDAAIEALATLSAKGHGSDSLAVPYISNVPLAGASPMTPVTAIFPGFDWDRGRVVVGTQMELGQPSQEARVLARRYSEITSLVAKVRILANSSKPDDQKVAGIKQLLDALGAKGLGI